MYKNKHTYLLFFGDLVALSVSLYFTLLMRYLVFPNKDTIIKHIVPFSILILAWCAIFFIAGLYEQHVLILKRNLAETIINTQIFNCILAALFFYFIPYFSLAPKTVLFIYLAVSLVLILIWRLFIFQKITTSFSQNAVVIGEGKDIEEIISELKMNPSYGILVTKHISTLEADSIQDLLPENTDVIIADFSKEDMKNNVSKMYRMLFKGSQFIKVHHLYESMFGRVPMTLINYSWFLENVSSNSKIAYRIFKRIIDIAMSLMIGVVLLFMYPFVLIAIKIEDGGKIILSQDRVGKNGKVFKLYKFRSMNVDDGGKWIEAEDSRHTKVGKFIRKTRIDELPQIINVLKGDISLIGPRPDLKKLWDDLSSEIQYYQIRNLVKPGLSGWAQITQDLPPQSVDDTKTRLSYDLYYIKHRSILLDLKIAIRTIKTLISRSGA